jgi:hypothetical protein
MHQPSGRRNRTPRANKAACPLLPHLYQAQRGGVDKSIQSLAHHKTAPTPSVRRGLFLPGSTTDFSHSQRKALSVSRPGASGAFWFPLLSLAPRQLLMSKRDLW